MCGPLKLDWSSPKSCLGVTYHRGNSTTRARSAKTEKKRGNLPRYVGEAGVLPERYKTAAFSFHSALSMAMRSTTKWFYLYVLLPFWGKISEKHLTIQKDSLVLVGLGIIRVNKCLENTPSIAQIPSTLSNYPNQLIIGTSWQDEKRGRCTEPGIMLQILSLERS